MPQITEQTICCFNGDTIHDLDLWSLLRAHAQDAPAATIVVNRSSDQPNSLAIAVNPNGRVAWFREKERREGVALDFPADHTARSNSGVYVFDRTRLLADWPVSLQVGRMEDGLIPHLCSQNAVAAFENGENLLIDIGTPERLALARALGEPVQRLFRSPDKLSS